MDEIWANTGNQITETAHGRGQRPGAANRQVGGSNMYDRTASYPFLDGAALGAREGNVYFDA
jgi:hypothetical protein